MALSFEQQIKRIIDNREGVTREIFAASAIQIAEKVITRTPVDTGRARGNWNSSINTADSGVSEKNQKQNTGVATNEAVSAASSLKLGDTFHLTNGLPYIKALEYGHSKGQAPRGMVRISVDEFNAALREVINRVS